MNCISHRFTEVEASQQITLLDQSLFGRLEKEEFEHLGWTKDDKLTRSPNIMKIIFFSNKVTHWVAGEILSTNDIKRRVECLEWFIRLGMEFLSLKNFNSAGNIHAGLAHTSVFRLTKTWKRISPARLSEWKELDNFFGLDQPDRTVYVKVIENHDNTKPLIPFMGID
eukprot:TRINITY_DN5015_c0_g2_i1.p1 TRINITY_DN5015_c0_g2~~TRINITY_DN5015_c0_g2_i1.p1  ORF type:complete len:168 (+),score=17.17 TRINITY_DN5015_c0_g2_i1:114-617(+)